MSWPGCCRPCGPPTCRSSAAWTCTATACEVHQRRRAGRLPLRWQASGMWGTRQRPRAELPRPHCSPSRAGPIPREWVQGGFAGGVTVGLRPGNPEVCGEPAAACVHRQALQCAAAGAAAGAAARAAHAAATRLGALGPANIPLWPLLPGCRCSVPTELRADWRQWHTGAQRCGFHHQWEPTPPPCMKTGCKACRSSRAPPRWSAAHGRQPDAHGQHHNRAGAD